MKNQLVPGEFTLINVYDNDLYHYELYDNCMRYIIIIYIFFL